MYKLSVAAVALLLLAVDVNAWGPLGHATVASIAMQYLLPETRSHVNKLLANDPAPFVSTASGSSTSAASASTSISGSLVSSIAAPTAPPTKQLTLVDIASWADDFRYTPEGAFSASFHYIDAEDEPPKKCNVKYQRDCGDSGCILSAIANYTSRVQDHSLDAKQRAQALKWITHFLGDIQQPLHDEAIAIGGNQINVDWNGTVVNLHHIWDTEMPTKLAGQFTPENVKAWTKKIVKELEFGQFRHHKWDWASCTDIDAGAACPLVWAREANSFVCSYVLKTDPTGKEASGAYYEGAAPIIEMQIAKGGVRLAAWLNTIFAGYPGLW